ncbi:MAG: hypothetical protein WBW82_08645, partial [Candidatus Sulfotelmatobacter sp.]
MPEGPGSELKLPLGAHPAESTAGSATDPVSRLRPILGVWLRDLIVSLAISAFIIVFIYQPVKVEGTSMMPSLED